MIFKRKRIAEIQAMEQDLHSNLLLPITPIPFEDKPVKMFGKKINAFTELNIPFSDINTGILIIGAPGCGKTVLIKTMVYQLDVQPNFPVVFFDPKGDYHEEFGKEKDVVLKVSNSTHSWNIFLEIETEEDFEEISAELFIAQHKDFWLSSAQQLFAAILKMMWREAKTQNIIPTNADLIHLLNTKSNAEIYDLLKDQEDLRSAAQYISPESGKQGSGVMSTLLTKVMEVFIGDFRKSDKQPFSVHEYMRQPVGRALFIEYDVTQGERLGPIYRLLIDTAIKFALQRGTESYKKYFIIDEFQWIPLLQKYQALVNYGRSYQATTITGLQAVSQMNAVYGKETTQAIMAGHKHQFIFRCGDPETVRYVRAKIGKAQLWQQQNQYLSTGSGAFQSHQIVNTMQHLQEYCPVSEEELLQLSTGDVFYISPENWRRAHLKMYEESRQIIDNMEYHITQSKKRLGM
ncbi:MAG: type IV secretion system DNA-binding domain-containing protein [Nanoarchaeota archaeon]|nr:type IV secretion system DNA-binding domain-containing protein [Nanoarchaeota archaeon]